MQTYIEGHLSDGNDRIKDADSITSVDDIYSSLSEAYDSLNWATTA